MRSRNSKTAAADRFACRTDLPQRQPLQRRVSTSPPSGRGERPAPTATADPLRDQRRVAQQTPNGHDRPRRRTSSPTVGLSRPSRLDPPGVGLAEPLEVFVEPLLVEVLHAEDPNRPEQVQVFVEQAELHGRIARSRRRRPSASHRGDRWRRHPDQRTRAHAGRSSGTKTRPRATSSSPDREDRHPRNQVELDERASRTSLTSRVKRLTTGPVPSVGSDDWPSRYIWRWICRRSAVADGTTASASTERRNCATRQSDQEQSRGQRPAESSAPRSLFRSVGDPRRRPAAATAPAHGVRVGAPEVAAPPAEEARVRDRGVAEPSCPAAGRLSQFGQAA